MNNPDGNDSNPTPEEKERMREKILEEWQKDQEKKKEKE